MADVTWESLANKPGGDHDELYVWGRPREYLSVVQQGWLTILRGFVMDARRHGEPRNCATGDLDCLDHTVLLPSGLIVPARTDRGDRQQ